MGDNDVEEGKRRFSEHVQRGGPDVWFFCELYRVFSVECSRVLRVERVRDVLVGDVLPEFAGGVFEAEDMGRMEEIVGVKETYRQGIKVMSLRNVQSLALILLTRHVAFSPAESLTQLKLLEKGVPKTFLASMNAVIAPLNIMMPMISAKWTAGAKPLRVVLNTFVYRGIACAFASVVVVAWTKVLAATAQKDRP